MEKIILASGSPRRKALMEQVGFEFEVVAADIDERVFGDGEIAPYDLVRLASAGKADHTSRLIGGDAVIIGADTVVSIHGKILGKPEDAAAARRMLKRLSGRVHSVYTGVAIIRQKDGERTVRQIVDTTKVFMRPYDDLEIDRYIATGEPFDKAGAYAAQGKGALLVERIDGDFHNVVGLPLVKLYLALREMGVETYAD